MRSPPVLAQGIYAITPDPVDFAQVLSVCRALLAEGIAALQYRNKLRDGYDARSEHVAALKHACDAFNTPLIVNDDVQLALQFGCGVHLGTQDGSIRSARDVLGPDAIVGASCYDQQSLGLEAIANGASYVAFGAFFASQTKPNAKTASLHLFRRDLPPSISQVAIGGIQPGHVDKLVTAGADLIAVVQGLFAAPDPVAALHSYRTAFYRSKGI